MEKTVDRFQKDWSMTLDDALWTYQTIYRTPLGTNPYRLVFETSCHWSV